MAEVRVLIQPTKDGQNKLSLVDPRSGQHINTGMKAPSGTLEGQVKAVKDILEKKGHHVTVKEM